MHSTCPHKHFAPPTSCWGTTKPMQLALLVQVARIASTCKLFSELSEQQFLWRHFCERDCSHYKSTNLLYTEVKLLLVTS